MADRSLWRLTNPSNPGTALECAMVSCCAGAELQVLRMDADGAAPVVLLRELYPTKSDLYERARLVRAEFEAAGFVVDLPPV